MRKSYNIPLNDTSMMEISSSPQPGYMPNFLIGNNNQNDSMFFNQSKVIQPTTQNFLTYENKTPRTSNIKRHESYHDGFRKHGPPITSLRNKSPKNYGKSFVINNDNSLYGSNAFNSVKLNQSSIRQPKPYENYNRKNPNNNNISIKESDAYSSFLTKNETINETDNEFENWVTIFGYAPSEARFVLTYFAEIGNIIDQKISNSGNWMHIQYQSKMHAIAAINRNGRIINLNVMIGVKPCDDKIVDVPPSNRFKEIASLNRTDNLNSSRIMEEPAPVKELNTNLSGPERMNGSLMNLSMRSLNTHNNSHFSPDKVETRPKTGILNRAMSMVFGRR